MPKCPNTCPIFQIGPELCAATVGQNISNNSFNAAFDKATELFTIRSICSNSCMCLTQTYEKTRRALHEQPAVLLASFPIWTHQNCLHTWWHTSKNNSSVRNTGEVNTTGGLKAIHLPISLSLHFSWINNKSCHREKFNVLIWSYPIFVFPHPQLQGSMSRTYVERSSRAQDQVR